MKRFLVCLAVFFNLATAPGRAQSGVVSNFDAYTSPSPDHSYELRGSALLFNTFWPHAQVELPNHKIFRNDSLAFNYNKLDQALLYTKDGRTMTTVDKRDFISVTFFIRDTVLILEHVNFINTHDLFLELVKEDDKYSLYENIVTLFKDVNYRNNGLASEGNTHGVLEDHATYFIVYQNKEYKKLNKIDRKQIEKAFSTGSDKEKVENWLANQKELEGEPLLWNLIVYLNQ